MRHLWLLLMLFSFGAWAQNVGINQSSPTQPLEVGGTIFTNSGGIMFPDSTVQTSAASTAAPYAQVDDRLYGVLDFTDAPFAVVGPYDFGSGPGSYQDIFYVYDMDYKVEAVFSAGGGGGDPSTSAPGFSEIRMLVDMGKGLPHLFKLLTDADAINEIELNLFDANEQLYYRMRFKDSYMTSITPRIIHKGSGNYAHVAEITLAPQIIVWEWLNEFGDVIQSSCWNVLTNNSMCN